MLLRDKVAFINGGARIGHVVAEQLAKRGCHLAISYRSSRSAAETTARVASQLGVQTKVLKADMTSVKDVKRAISSIKQTLGGLDILINMASGYEQTRWTSLNEKTWNKIIDSNLKSAYLAGLYAAPELRRRRGRIINFADWLAASGRPRYKNFLPYYSAKMGIIGLTQAQALELAPEVLVNAIAPGPILPPSGASTDEIKEVEPSTPLGRWGGSIEIAKAVIFLCETDFVTGECVRVDGGRHLY